MDFDLNSRSSKLEKDQMRRRDEAKKKLERERRLIEEQKRKEAEILNNIIIKKQEAEAIEQMRREQENIEMILTGGVNFKMSNLSYYRIDGEDDKVILPEEALQQLINQDASTKGPMLFEIIAKTADNRGTLNICK